MSAVEVFLGIDVGTSVIKVAAYTVEGMEITHATTPAQGIIPFVGGSEMDMHTVWMLTATTIRIVTDFCMVHHFDVIGVGVTGNMVGAWLIDRDGSPVGNAILWNDGRAQATIDVLSEQHPGLMGDIFSYSGSVMQAGCSLPILRWLADHQPERLKGTKWVLNCKGWIAYCLTGMVSNDCTEAAVAPGDTRTKTYSETVLSLLNVSAFRDRLPEVYDSQAPIGSITPSAAVQTGLPSGLPVIAGAGDVPAAAIGVGAFRSGDAVTSLGTTCLNSLVIDEPIFTPENVGLLFALPERGWLRTMVNIAGTTNLDWGIRQFFAHEHATLTHSAELFTHVESVAKTSPVGANGVIYLPYLSAVGIIAPVVAPKARAQFSGLHDQHTRADMVRAMYEGIALSIRDCYRAMTTPIEVIALTGGATKSAWLSQMIADCVGVRVQVPIGQEFGARGVAMLAMVGAGVYGSVTEAVHVVTGQAHNIIYLPDAEALHTYDEVYTRYRAASSRYELTP